MTKCAPSVSIYQEEEERGGGKCQGMKRACKRCGERKEIEYEGGDLLISIFHLVSGKDKKKDFFLTRSPKMSTPDATKKGR